MSGSRQGRILLIRLRDAVDPETEERFTVKRYTSEKTDNEDGWRHVRITLEPSNPAFEPIVMTGDEEGDVDVIAELLEVLGCAAPESGTT
ncbi:MAG TPA: hypothetical protein ENJ09_03725 [Planctomycetes bacterium]|nr:hypothetical protein [Planctomycetota bacterium]